MKRKVITLTVTAAMVASLAACSSTGGSNSSTSGAPGPSALKDAKGVTNITIWHGLGAANGIAFTALINQFNAENKGKIHVSATYQGIYADLLAKYTAGLRSNTTPTILLAGDVATGYMNDVGRSISAASMAKANPGTINLSNLSSAARSYYTVGGIQKAVPMNVSTPMLWVNKELLAKAGVSLSSLSTLDGMVAAAKAVSAETGENGFTMPDDDWYVEQLTAKSGQNFCTPDNGRNGKPITGITINSGLAKESITKVADLYRTGVAVDGAPDGSAAITAFQAGKVGLMLNSSGVLGALKAGTPFDYEALPFPSSGPSATSGNVIGGSALWLSSTASKAQQVAGWKLETYLTSPAAQEQFSHATGYIPINNKTNTRASQKTYLAENPNSQAFITQVANIPAVSQTAGCVTGAMTSIRTGNINQLQAAFAGTKTVDAALEQASSDAKTAIKQYQQQLGK